MRRLTGKNPLLFSEEISNEQMKKIDVAVLLGQSKTLTFQTTISGLPAGTVDVGMIAGRHWYKSTRGLIMWSDGCYGTALGSRIKFKNYQWKKYEGRFRLFLCRWSCVRSIRGGITFVDLNTVMSPSRAKKRLEKLIATSIRYGKVRRPLSIEDMNMDAKAKDGAVVDSYGYVCVRKGIHGCYYRFVKILSLKDYLMLKDGLMVR